MAVTYSTTLVAVSCGECGVPFGVPNDLHRHYTETGSRFHCLNGHRISYAETEVKKLRSQVRRLEDDKEFWHGRFRDEREEHEQTARSRAAIKGVLTKTKKRVGKGVCPCCNRHFENLQRHMDSKHPEYSDEQVGDYSCSCGRSFETEHGLAVHAGKADHVRPGAREG